MKKCAAIWLCERNDFPLGPSLPVCAICGKRVYHTWQAGWIYLSEKCTCFRPGIPLPPGMLWQQLEITLVPPSPPEE